MWLSIENYFDIYEGLVFQKYEAIIDPISYKENASNVHHDYRDEIPKIQFLERFT